MIDQDLTKINELVTNERKSVDEITSLFNSAEKSDNEAEKEMINKQIETLKASIKKSNDELLKILEAANMVKTLEVAKQEVQQKKAEPTKQKEPLTISRLIAKERIPELEQETLKRIKRKGEKVVKKKEVKPSLYVSMANNFFADFVKTLIKQRKLKSLEKDLIKSNLQYTPTSYISILIFTTILSAIIAFVLFIFFLFFNLSPEFPIITLATEGIALRFIKVIWILFFIPLGTFLFIYLYPSLEKRTIEGKINQELPFATIHMAAISGSLIEPTKVFTIIASTKDYPYLEKEFNKLLNKINIYGFDLVTALKDSAINSPSHKLAELFNGLATTITSGGDLFDFFDKRAQSLLFEYRLDKEKRTKTSETFMDIYISVVIAAPMILMLLLMMIKISGLGVSLPTSTITVLVVGGVSLINVIFLIFLQIKQSATA